ncbi:MAG: VWA domain-containing protein [Armatimonadetes bacterium]|nr:VWA domain-containing protein [Armatimonadota bacterium]
MDPYMDLTVELSQSAILPSATPQVVYGLVRMMPKGQSSGPRLPLDLRFLLDRSGSMGSNAARFDLRSKLDALQDAVGAVIDQLVPGDRITVISFDDRTREEVPPTLIQSAMDQRRAKMAVEAIRLGGGTHMSGGLRKVIRSDSRTEGSVKRGIIFTDGEVNSPSEAGEERNCTTLAQEAGQKHFPLTLFGTGVEYNDRFLEKLARESNGRSEHLEDATQAVSVFMEEVGYLQEVSVMNLEVTLAVVDSSFTSVSRVVPQIEPQVLCSPNYFSTYLGDVDKVRGQAILFSLHIPPFSQVPLGGKLLLGRAEVVFDVPSKRLKGARTDQVIEIRVTDDPNQVVVNLPVLTTVKLEGATKLQTKALDLAQAGNVHQATAMLSQVATLYQSAGQEDLATKAMTLTNALTQNGGISGDTLNVQRTLTTASKKMITKRLTTQSDPSAKTVA